MKIQIESTTKLVTLTESEASGRTAYEAYRNHTGGKSLATGDPIPQWDQLPITIQEAWEAAAAAFASVGARIWEGHTESGIPVHCYVTRIAVANGQDTSQFERELQEHAAPSADIAAIPLHLIL